MEIDPIEMLARLKQIDPNFWLLKSIAIIDTYSLAVVKNSRTNKSRTRRSNPSQGVLLSISN